MTNKKAGHTLASRPAILSGKKLNLFSYPHFNEPEEINQPIKWGRFGIFPNTKSFFDYEKGKDIIDKWNLDPVQHSSTIRDLIEYLGV